MSRFKLCGLLALALLTATLISHFYFPAQVDRGFKNEEIQERLKAAHTADEFEAILGKPGNYSARKHEYFPNPKVCLKGWKPGDEPVTFWKDDYAVIDAYFSPDGKLRYYIPWYADDGRIRPGRTWLERMIEP